MLLAQGLAMKHGISTDEGGRADCGSVRGRVAGEAEPAPGIPGGDGGERRAEGGLQGLPRAGAARPQARLELGPGLLDRVHVGRVGREETFTHRSTVWYEGSTAGSGGQGWSR